MNEKSIGLAPMEGVTDFPTRLWFSLVGGVRLMATPFCRLTPGMNGSKIPSHWAPELFYRPIAGKLSYGLTPQIMAQDVELAASFGKAVLNVSEFVELNCGCPSPRAVGGGAGSALLKEPEVFGSFLQRLCQVLGPGKLSVKMRLGFERADEFERLMPILQRTPLYRVIIHGRTRADSYRGDARWQEINEAAMLLPYPVIGSGDICDVSAFRKRAADSEKLAGVLIGRGALRNPWIFSELSKGVAPTISVPLLVSMLECFARLHGLHQDNPTCLLELVAANKFSQSFEQDLSKWSELKLLLRQLQPNLAITSLGRTKMLWNYLRSGLDPVFFERGCLRAKSLEEIVERIEEMAPAREFIPGWRAELDWAFGKGSSSEVS